jgi:hypothetical protein
MTIDETRRPNIFQVASLPYMKRLINEFEGVVVSANNNLYGTPLTSTFNTAPAVSKEVAGTQDGAPK